MELSPQEMTDSQKDIDVEVDVPEDANSFTPTPFPVQQSSYKLMGTESDMNHLIDMHHGKQ